MKLTEEQNRAISVALGYDADEVTQRSEETWVARIFLAGCAWQRERDAKLCEGMKAYNDPAECAAAIRAQGDDHE